MENFEDTEPTDGTEQEQEQLVVTEEIRRYIYETARWTKFLSIVGLVFSLLIALMAFSATAIIEGLSMVTPANPLVQLGTTFLTVYFLCISLMIFYPSFLLFKYANAANTAVLYADQENFTIAMEKMKSVFKFWGIIVIIMLALNALSFVLAIIAKLGVG
jgi:hypothetical protein